MATINGENNSLNGDNNSLNGENNSLNGDSKKIADLSTIKFDKFELDTSIHRYFSQWEASFRLKNVSPSECQYKDIFLTFFGNKNIELVDRFCYPDSIETLSFKEIKSICFKLFKPTSTAFASRFDFVRLRRTTETITEFADKIRKIGKRCHYLNDIDERLRDQFMVGMEIPGLERDLRALYPDGLDRDNNVLTFQFILDLIWKIQQNRENRAKLTAEINGLDVEFDFDTGAQASLIGIDIWTSIGRPKIRPTSPLTAYGDHPLDVKGETQVNVRIGSQTRTLPVVIMNTTGVPLFGLQWIIAFNLEMPRQVMIKQVRNLVNNIEKEKCCITLDPRIRDLINKHQEISEENQDSKHALDIRSINLDDMQLSENILRKESKQDLILKKVAIHIQQSWRNFDRHKDKEIVNFYNRREELSVNRDIIEWNGRLVIPNKLRNAVLGMIHWGHPGENVMKSIFRLYCWWPRCDVDIENFIKICSGCQKNRPWLEVDLMQNTSADAMIKRLNKWFARFGIPKYSVSDKGPQFLSGEFRRYCDLNNIRHIRSAPYHPKTNGLAERTVRTLKGRYYATRDSISDPEEAMTQVLTTYRLGEHSSTGRSPAKIMFGRQLKTSLDWIRPNAEHEIVRANDKQSLHHDLHSKEREFEISQPIWLNNENTNGWREGVIKERIGLYSYIVESSGKTLRKHADQLRNRLVIPNHESSLEVTEMVVPVNEANTNTNTNTTLRCSSRNHKPTKRFIEEI